MDKELADIQTHVSFKYEDAQGETLYEYSQGGAGTAIPAEGELVT